jgi:hypothetical protein
MRVASHPVIANATRGSGLPASASVLDVLARLGEEELTEAIEAGEVTASTTRQQAASLVKRKAYEDRIAARAAEVDAAVAEARGSGDPVALYRALDESAEYYQALAGVRLTCQRCGGTANGDYGDGLRLCAGCVGAIVAEWSLAKELDAACDSYRAGTVAVFRKYEGMTTDAGDTVTVETFAEHVDIPVETFRQWVDGR